MREGAAVCDQNAAQEPRISGKVVALLAALGALIVLPLSTEVALADKRVALVIGNGVYQNVVKLPNPTKDATAVANLFKRAGFEWVQSRQDLSSLEFKRALREFMEAAQDADVAVVYYAGHGIQVRETNYIIPVDATLATEFDVQDEAIPLDRILTAIEPAKRLRLVILDACRENPFANRMKVANATRSIGRGLARVEPENNVMVAYAAKSGQVALDGTGENSPFTAALVKHLAVPGLDIRLAFGRIRDEVVKSTGFKQEPFVYGSLGGDAISLVPTPVQPKPETVSSVKADYELVRELGTQKAWEAFLNSHKDGLYAELAREQLAKLVQQAKSVGSTEGGGAQRISLATLGPAVLPKPSPPSSKERAEWELVRDSGDRIKLREFIEKYGASPLAEQAKNRLDVLDRAAQEREEKARAEQEATLRRQQEAVLRREQEAKRLEAEEAARKAAQTAAVREKLEAQAAKSNMVAPLPPAPQTTHPTSEISELDPQPAQSIANSQPEPKPDVRPSKRAKAKPTARQRDEDQDRQRHQAQPKREERREASRARYLDRRPFVHAASRPTRQPIARSQALATPAPALRHSGGMVGVGF